MNGGDTCFMLPFVRPGNNFRSPLVLTREVVATSVWLSVRGIFCRKWYARGFYIDDALFRSTGVSRVT
jgi:hypothetical protein